jgi:hypothetical protein
VLLVAVLDQTIFHILHTAHVPSDAHKAIVLFRPDLTGEEDTALVHTDVEPPQRICVVPELGTDSLG